MVEIVFLGINGIGERIYDWLTDREEDKVLALLTEPDQLSLVKELEPELLVSAGFRHIVPEEILAIPKLGAVNVHKSYLPFNRGANPNVWSIIEKNPVGVSIHYMTPEVDAGPIIDRREVPVHPDDDGRDLYNRLEEAQFKQFVEIWPRIRDGSPETQEQDPDEGTYHYKKEFVDLWELDLEKQATIGDILDQLRALTFPPYKNAYFESNGQRYYVEISITPADEFEGGIEVEQKNAPTYNEEDYE